MATAEVPTASPDEQLAWEAEQRPRAAIAAISAAMLAILGAIFSRLSLTGAPTPTLPDSLRNLERPGPIGDHESLRVPLFQFFSDHAASVLAGAVLLGLAAVAAALTLSFLARAARARSERFPRFGTNMALVGAAAVLVGSVLVALGTRAWVDDLLASSHTIKAFADISRPLALDAGQIIVQVGGLVLAGSYVLVALHSMRTGLLPRAWGILGIFVGVMVVLPVPLFSDVLQPVWLLAVALLILQRWPGGTPPAWITGKAEPWPTGAQLREERQTARGGPVAKPKAKAAERPVPAAGRPAKPHPSSKKRKRKRRG